MNVKMSKKILLLISIIEGSSGFAWAGIEDYPTCQNQPETLLLKMSKEMPIENEHMREKLGAPVRILTFESMFRFVCNEEIQWYYFLSDIVPLLEVFHL